MKPLPPCNCAYKGLNGNLHLKSCPRGIELIRWALERFPDDPIIQERAKRLSPKR